MSRFNWTLLPSEADTFPKVFFYENILFHLSWYEKIDEKNVAYKNVNEQVERVGYVTKFLPLLHVVGKFMY